MVRVNLEFSGGLELLVSGCKVHQADIEAAAADGTLTVGAVLLWVRDHLLTERPEMLLKGQGVQLQQSRDQDYAPLTVTISVFSDNMVTLKSHVFRRPGILVLVNDCDWELCGKLAAEDALNAAQVGLVKLKCKEPLVVSHMPGIPRTHNDRSDLRPRQHPLGGNVGNTCAVLVGNGLEDVQQGLQSAPAANLATYKRSTQLQAIYVLRRLHRKQGCLAAEHLLTPLWGLIRRNTARKFACTLRVPKLLKAAIDWGRAAHLIQD
eukprot:SM000126S26347  [mRNA]  locus=s126:398307:400289:+ [translate_table: standard]